MNNLKFALRQLWKHPGFTVVAVLTLAFGIGMNTSMFSLMNALLLRPLPYPEPARLARLYRTDTHTQTGGFSPADFFELKRQEAAYGKFAAYQNSSVILSEPGQPAELQNSLRVSTGFFDVLGTRPQLGRFFLPGEEINGNDRVLVISHALWQGRFAGAPDIVGRTMRVDGEARVIVGVLPEEAHDRRLFGPAGVFTPLAFTEGERQARGARGLNILGRRNHAATARQGEAFIAALGARLAAEFPAENGASGWRSEGLRESTMNPRGRLLLLLLLGLSGLVTLIACSNLANLMLARTVARAREFAVRAALGASRRQLVLPLAVESCLLAAGGGAGALLVSVWTSRWLGAQIPRDIGAALDFPLDWRVLGFTLGVSLLAILFFGVAPALLAARINAEKALKGGTRAATAGPGQQRLRHALIIAQFALAMILLAGAGYFIRGADNALRQEHGWNADHLVQGSLQLGAGSHAGKGELEAFHQRIVRQLEGLPGVASASLSYALPYRGFNNSGRYVVEGRAVPPAGQEPLVSLNGVTSSYFDTTGTRLIRGRAFTSADTESSPKTGIISETMARALFPNEDPLGRRIARAGAKAPEWIEIVGVVADTRPVDVAHQPASFQFYRPLAQERWNYSDGRPAQVFLAVRAPGVAVESLSKAVGAEMAALDANLPVRDLMPGESMIARISSQMHLFRKLLTGFAALGLSLAALGIYGVIARTVAQRTAEIGVRMALGAQVADVIRLILGSGLRLAGTGSAIGLLAAFGLGRVLTSTLPGLQSNGGLVLAATTVLLVLSALLACWLPARRASKIDPMEALRQE